MKKRFLSFLLALATLSAAGLSTNAPGTLDSSFGSGGIVTTPVGDGPDYGSAVAVQSDGKIVVAGSCNTYPNTEFALVRYTTSGDLDTDFGAGTGKVITSVSSGYDSAEDVAIQSDGKIVVAGWASNGTNLDFAVVRYTSDGALDTTFGSGTGKVLTSLGSGDDSGKSLAIQSDGKIIVAGYTLITSTSSRFALVRYNADGSLDSSFNGTGKVITSVGSGTCNATSLALQSDGKILVAGSAAAANVDFALVRYNADGSLDASFNGTGIVITPVGTSHDDAYSVAVQGDGKIVVAGTLANGSEQDFALVRYTSTGALDSTFYGSGKVITSIGNIADYVYDIAVQSSGTIVVAGTSFTTQSDRHIVLARYRGTGALDRNFNGTGIVETYVGSVATVEALAVQPDGNLVAAGFAVTGSSDFVVLRYDGQPGPPSGVCYVKADAVGANNGRSWADAYTELTSAIEAADFGEEIWVASGIYYPDYDPVSGTHTGDRTRRFALKNNVALYGGFTGTETSRSERDWATNRTILSGDIGQRGVFSDNTRTIMAAPTSVGGALVEGFVFAAGNADDPAELGGGIVGGSGGAVYIYTGNAEFRNCAFVGNYAVYGGAIFIRGASGPGLVVSDCLFAANSARYVGGAIDFTGYTGNFDVRNCTITGNSGSRGAAIGTNSQVSCTYLNNIIHGNTATDTGWQKVETGNGSPNAQNNILEAALIPAGTNNQVVANAGFARTPTSGPDGRWGTMDDVLDASLTSSSPAIGFASADFLPIDTSDADGDGDNAEPIPFDLLHRPRALSGAPDAGAFEFSEDVTVGPTLIAPANGTLTTRPVQVTFDLPEPAKNGTLKLIFENASVTRVLVLAESLGTGGNHSFTFDPTNPVSEAIATGAVIPDGTYTVRLSYQDLAGNPPASSSNLNIMLDATGPSGGTMTLWPLGAFNVREGASVYFHDWADARSPLSYQLFIDGTAVAPAAATNAFYFTVPVTAGTHTYEGHITDSLGNVTVVSEARSSLGTLVLESPAFGARTKGPVEVSFILPAAAAPGSVTLTFDEYPSGATHIFTLAPSLEAAGPHSFTFDPSQPLSAPEIASANGPSLPDNTYTVTLSFTYEAGDAVSVAAADYVELDTVTQTPLLITSTDIVSNTPLALAFGFPEGMTAGTAKLVFSGAATRELTIGPNHGATDRFHFISFKPGDPVNTSNGAIVAGDSIPDGAYSLTLSYQDRLGNAAAVSTALNLTVDATPPQLSGAFAPLTVYAGTPLADYAAQASVTDTLAVTLTQSPRPGMITSVGVRPVVISATDEAGNTSEITFNVAIRAETPQSAALIASGADAPGAGLPGAPPEHAVLSSFGIPAIDEDGTLAFTARWEVPGTRMKGSGLFTTTACLALANEPVAQLGDARFTHFSDPVIRGGKIACIARLAGPGNGSAILFGPAQGPLAMLAKTGAEAPGAGGATFKSFSGVEVFENGVGFLARLAAGTGSPRVTAATDRGLWLQDGSQPLALILREGPQQSAPLQGKTIRTLTAFQSGNGSPGQGRGWVRQRSEGCMLALAHFADGTQAVIEAGLSGVTELSSSAPDVGTGFVRFGFPASNSAGQTAFAASLAVGDAITRAKARGIFVDYDGTQFTTLARIGDHSDVNGAKFTQLNDPILADDGGVAFLARVRSASARGMEQRTLWWKPAGGGLRLLAQAGPGTIPIVDLPDAQWRSFSSVALASRRGPIFSATLSPLKGGIERDGNDGLWACDFEGTPRLLFRTGVEDAILPGKTLKTFRVLRSSSGSAGVTRSFNSSQQIVWHATFTDRTEALVTTEIP